MNLEVENMVLNSLDTFHNEHYKLHLNETPIFVLSFEIYNWYKFLPQLTCNACLHILYRIYYDTPQL